MKFARLAIKVLILTSIVFIANHNLFAVPKSESITIDHLMKLKKIKDVQVSPDGKWVAYKVSRNDEKKDKGFSQIWMSSVDGKEQIPLTASYANASNPRWNPDGSSIAFIGKRGADKKAKSQVWILNRNGGEAQQYTKVKQGVSEFEWAPDGKSMLLVLQDPKPEKKNKNNGKASDDEDKPEPIVIDRLQFKQDYIGYLDRRREHIYLFDGINIPTQITSGDFDDGSAVWSPDGSKIAFVSKREGDPDGNDNSDIWIVNADPKAKKHPLIQVTKNKGRDSNPSWSPNGTMIAYTTTRKPKMLWYENSKIAITKAGTGGQERIINSDYDQTSYQVRFGHKGKNIYFIPDDNGNNHLSKINIISGEISQVTQGELVVENYDISGQGVIAAILSSHYNAVEVYRVKGNKLNRISNINDKALEKVKLAKVKRLTVAGWNNEPVESFVYYPLEYKKGRALPTVFLIHGGPTAQHDTAFNDWAQLFAAQGYLVVLPNPHGSTGYGEAFSYALNAQWGVPDFEDIDKIADHLVKQGLSDADKLAVSGWSYGGILTNYVITKSTRFAAAISGASELNHRANYGHDHYQHYWEVELGLPWENTKAWEAINAFNDIGKVTTPTLVMGGQMDWNVPIQNSEQLYQALKRLGIDTQLIVYPNEGHGFKRPSFKRDRIERWLDWFSRYLKEHKKDMS